MSRHAARARLSVALFRRIASRRSDESVDDGGDGSLWPALPKQHGAPVRIVVPWKYGYKSIKSIVKMDFIASQPTTFWRNCSPTNIRLIQCQPGRASPRWSQATERMIDTGDRVKTQRYNGYGSYVAKLYGKALIKPACGAVPPPKIARPNELFPMRKPSLAIIFLTVFIDLIGFGLILPLLPIYSSHLGASGFVIGAIMASYSLMQFIFAPIWDGSRIASAVADHSHEHGVRGRSYAILPLAPIGRARPR